MIITVARKASEWDVSALEDIFGLDTAYRNCWSCTHKRCHVTTPNYQGTTLKLSQPTQCHEEQSKGVVIVDLEQEARGNTLGHCSCYLEIDGDITKLHILHENNASKTIVY